MIVDLTDVLSQLQAHKVLEVSIRHFPFRDREELFRSGNEHHPSDPLHCTTNGSRVRIRCEDIEDPGQVQRVLDFGYTTAVTDWLQYGYALGCKYIVMRKRIPEYEHLPTFDW